jgi:hypothetical protein
MFSTLALVCQQFRRLPVEDGSVVLIGYGRGVEVLGIERFAGGFDLVDGGLQTLIGDAVPDDEEGDKSRDEEDDGQGDPFQPPAARRMRGGGGQRRMCGRVRVVGFALVGVRIHCGHCTGR